MELAVLCSCTCEYISLKVRVTIARARFGLGVKNAQLAGRAHVVRWCVCRYLRTCRSKRRAPRAGLALGTLACRLDRRYVVCVVTG